MSKVWDESMKYPGHDQVENLSANALAERIDELETRLAEFAYRMGLAEGKNRKRMTALEAKLENHRHEYDARYAGFQATTLGPKFYAVEPEPTEKASTEPEGPFVTGGFNG